MMSSMAGSFRTTSTLTSLGVMARSALTLIEIEPSQPHPDEIRRRIRQWSIGAEDGELNLLPRFHIAADNQPVRCVPARHDRTAPFARTLW